VKPSADLSRLEEVLVITQQEEKEPALADGATPMRAADILAQRLPSVPDRPPDDPNKPPPPTSGLKILPAPTASGTSAATVAPKASGTSGSTQAQSSPGQNSPATTPKPRGNSAGTANNSGTVSAGTKPSDNSSAVKPAAQKKPAAPVVPDNATNNSASGHQTQLAPAKQNQPSQPAVVQPSQEQPQ